MNADPTTSQDTVPPAVDPLHGQPHQIVERDGVRYTLLGTAHISQASIDAVRAAIDSGAYDTVAVELDAGRLPHGLLFAGPEDLGKRALAEKLAMRALCLAL